MIVKRVSLLILCALFASAMALFMTQAVQAEDPPPELPPGMVAGEGTHFEVTDSDYLNVTLDSSQPVSVTLHSHPNQIHIEFRRVSAATSAQVTINGLAPSTTFYKYEDDVEEPFTFTTDADGGYVYSQDLSAEHAVRIQPMRSTLYLRDTLNGSGGDCYRVGSWYPPTKTCTLTSDVYDTIQIVGNGITLDGNGMTIFAGSDGDNGVVVVNRSDVTIKNLNITTDPRYLPYRGNGVFASRARGLTINNVTVRTKDYGLNLSDSVPTVLNSTLDDNRIHGLYIDNRRVPGGAVRNNTISNDNSSGMYVLRANGVSINDNIITGNALYGLYLVSSFNSSISRNTFDSNNWEGVRLYLSSGNTIYHNNFLHNRGGQALNRGNNSWFLSATDGGNYWDHYDTQAEGCSDTDNDRFCDAPLYIQSSEYDYFPWTTHNGWDLPPPSDSTPPVITPNVAGAIGNNGWYIGDVTVSWTLSDPESAVTSSSGCQQTVINADTAGTPLTCTATSDGGTASASVTIKRDATHPSAAASASPPANSNGWNSSDVTVSFSGTDNLSGVAFCDFDVLLSAEGAGQSASGACTDRAGNVSDPATASGINIDKTAPTATASASPAPNPNGWNNTDVTVSFSGSDNLSGIASCTANALLTAEGIGQSASGTCTDQAGNVSDPATASGINIDKTAPTAAHGGPFTVDEGSSVTLDGTESTDALSGVASTAWALDGDGVYDDGDPAVFNGIDDGVNLVSLQVVDLAGNEAIAGTQVTVENVAPTIDSLTGPAEPVDIGDQSAVSVDVAFGDPGTADSHDVTWDWGDGSTHDTQSAASSPAAQGHTYNMPGVYAVTVTVTDDDGGAVSQDYEYIVVYDPDGGFVTGGGWIDSPLGAYAVDPSLTGRANFGFVSKYKKGATTPTGETEFQFKAGDLNFHSSSYEWLVVTGSDKAKYKGVGTINGAGNYGFMLTATDNGSGDDTFRIKIWDIDNGDAVVYDNQMGAGDDAYDGTMLGGGNIKVHNK